jgi:hypothetical protein
MFWPKIQIQTGSLLQRNGQIIAIICILPILTIAMLLSPNGEWTLFTGDQLGSIFASQVLQAYKTSGKPIDKLAMVASTVSSKMIESMAKIEGFKFTECLTGAPHCPLLGVPYSGHAFFQGSSS